MKKKFLIMASSFVLATMFTANAMSESSHTIADGPALLLQQTPPQGGIVTPGVGVHSFNQNSKVTLTAIPKPGYHFVYWIGDVSDTTANNTVVSLNSPKIVIAVFERATYPFLVGEGMSQGVGHTQLQNSSVSVTSDGGGGNTPPHNPPKPPNPPVPEPATMALLSLGILFGKRFIKSGRGAKA